MKFKLGFVRGAIACILLLTLQNAAAQSFQEAAFLALAKDPRIGAAVASAEGAQAQVAQARAAGQFQVTARLQAQSDGSSRDTSSQTGVLELSKELYTFGRLATSIEAAEERVKLAWIEVGRTSQDVFYEVALAYVEVLQADELWAIRREFTQEVTDRMNLVEQRIEAGIAGVTELQALSRLYAEAQVAELLVERDTITSRLELERLTGIYVDTVWHHELLAYLDFVPDSAQQTLHLADLNAPESLISSQRYEIVEAQIRAQKRANNPGLQLFSTLNYQEQSGFESNSSDFGFRLSVPIYQGGARGAIAEQNRLSREEALRLRQEDQQQIRQFAAVAWATLGISQRAEQVWDQVVQIQKQRIQAIQNEVDADLRSPDTLLDARAEMTETRVDHARARYDVIRAQLTLLRTVGLASLASEL